MGQGGVQSQSDGCSSPARLLLHASFNGFFTLLLSIAGNMSCASWQQLLLIQNAVFPECRLVGWCTTGSESELNATHPAWKGYIPHFSSIQHLR